MSSGQGQEVHAVREARHRQSGTGRGSSPSQGGGYNSPSVSKDRDGKSQTRKGCDKRGFEHSKDASALAKLKQCKSHMIVLNGTTLHSNVVLGKLHVMRCH